MENQVPITEPEKESVYQRLQRRVRESHNEERCAWLALVQRVAPDTLPRLQEIDEIAVLRSAVEEVLVERLKR